MTETMETPRSRAKSMSADERRAMIIDALIPLLIEHGRAVTTRQIADAADVAEGTIFRVFGDKETLFAAAVETFLDPAPSQRALRAIDPELPLEAKVNDILFLLRSRMTGIFGIMHAVGMSGRPPRSPRADNVEDVVAEILRPDLERLGVPVERAASLCRLVAFAAAMPHFNVGHEIRTDELAQLITYGIAGRPAEGRNPDAS